MILIRLISMLPLGVLYVFSDLLYLVAYYLIGYRKKVVQENLANAFPNKSCAERKQIEKDFYRNFTDSLAETIKLLTMGKKELNKRFLSKNAYLIFDRVNKGEIVIGMCGHFFNWEGHLLTVSSEVQEKCETIYTKINHPFFEKLMFSIRSRLGAKISERKSFQRNFLKNRHLPRLIVLAADQRPNQMDIRYRTSFMNRQTVFFEGGEKLAKKFGLTVIYAYTSKPKRGHYIFEYHILSGPPYTDHSPHSITEKFISLVERNIEDQPALYLWSHNRWKNQAKTSKPENPTTSRKPQSK
ncbi:lysophospholipid acyltransferase family protein [Cyclobacterium plantarum]|uniref:Lipid A biosynthesis acyltransferase n=1 Tax=Cyclobacterium plantarum TaxID=2716263 RepID=A0ABX0HB71_9BACT|nr:lysophospholipid acyltransferase family protein [Cyclobacterium plantarum]NHE57686.1 lipid A biosynthesis acyltransferase [Cyclobacterium plantarum]